MYGLFEDEDDIFMGSPKSKLMDILFNANNDVVRHELEKFIDRAAAMELMMIEKFGEDVDKDIKRFMISNMDDTQDHAKSLYIELMGAILSQSE
ncbi:MAG: DUF2018 family protein [Sulfurimonas sp.]|uniref:DUF2018 family protein n=1 Tax=Sulfurimonas sp. TaxID=2022749 RepID=UPI0025DFD5BA|nr:DUF2018 family protein [Sulfurimonas sp.]MCK9454353.1 DUF2018 family protein [Sulfurimonas sp.]